MSWRRKLLAVFLACIECVLCSSETFANTAEVRGESGGIPHLAKNERDVGHPAVVEGIALRLVVYLQKNPKAIRT
jgi:hypothetical protein